MDFLPTLVELNLDLRKSLVPALLEVTITPDDKHHGAMSFLAGKACKTHEAIIILAKQGYGQDAGVLVRSMVNLVINEPVS